MYSASALDQRSVAVVPDAGQKCCVAKETKSDILLYMISKLLSNSIKPHSWARYTNATCGHPHAQSNILKTSTLKTDVLLL